MNNLKFKKKKGFTLIELIVVIAILAVLALIIVPRVTGYVASAKVTQIKADAKTVQQAVEAYDANHDGAAIPDGTTVSGLTTYNDASINDVIGKLGEDTTVSSASVGQLQVISKTGTAPVK